MKKLVALALCLSCLVAFLVLFLVLTSGDAARLLAGRPPEWGWLRLPYTGDFKRAALLAAVVAGGFLALDAYSLFARNPLTSGGRQPCDDPLGYARVRLRRYLLASVVLCYLVLVWKVLGWGKNWMPLDAERPLEVNAMLPVFVALFLQSRRPLNWTHFEVIQYIARLLVGAAEAFQESMSRSRRG